MYSKKITLRIRVRNGAEVRSDFKHNFRGVHLWVWYSTFVSILAFPLTLLSILDKLLITYWYKPKPVYSELLDRTFFFLLKYAPVLLLAIAGGTIYNSYCISNNKVQFLENFNHF